MLEGLAGVRLRKEEANVAERRVREVTGWNDPVEEKMGFVEAACQNYEVLVEDKGAGKTGWTGPSQRYETQSGQKQNDAGASGAPDKAKKAIEHRNRKDHGPMKSLGGTDPRQQSGVVDVGSARDRQEGVPRLHRSLGETEKSFDGAGAGEVGGGADDEPRRHGLGRRVGGKPLFEATLG